MRKGNGQEAKLCFGGHALMENRNGLLVDVLVTEANGRAERDAALAMLDAADIGRGRRATLGADKSSDARAFVQECRERNVTPPCCTPASSTREERCLWTNHPTRGLRSQSSRSSASNGGELEANAVARHCADPNGSIRRWRCLQPHENRQAPPNTAGSSRTCCGQAFAEMSRSRNHRNKRLYWSCSQNCRSERTE